MRALERDGLIRTVNSQMQATLDLARKAGQSKASVLITGESGTGKELLAREIHRISNRNRQRFVAINCAALPEGLLESELFGYEKGAFTGANQSKCGKFELAHQGTLLLDEVTEMSVLLQAKLLRALQEGEIDRLGSSKSLSVDVRVVATSNRDVRDRVQRNEFREDLYFRLNVIPIHIPPLRERVDDIEFLASYFAEECSRINGKGPKRFTFEALNAMKAYSWPGNVRELENTVERAVVLSDQPQLTIDDLQLPREETSGQLVQTNRLNDDDAQAGRLFEVGMTLHELEERAIQETLKMTNGNRTQTARILGLSVRALRYKLNAKEGELSHE